MRIGIDISLARKAGASAPPAVPWTPLDLGVALKAWWDADSHGTANMTDDGAGLISSWKDKVGAMNITAVTTARPTWAATSFNSAYAGVTSDGVANCLVAVSPFLATLPLGATAGEIWVLFSHLMAGATTGTKMIVAYGGNAANTDREVNRTSVASTNRVAVLDNATGVSDTVTNFTGPTIIGGAWSGTTVTARINGAASTPASGTIPTLATSGTRFTMFCNNGGSAANWVNGVMRHTLITTTLALADRQKMEGWMAHNHGLTSLLPAGHPYKSVRP